MDTIDALIEAMEANQKLKPNGLYSAGEIIEWLERQKSIILSAKII